ncbi:Metallo-beta-lactamase domain-containing protein 1 [Taenia solium]|eukprot:TsM_000558300 transcript=TsM_000558300 gene=TsM_000558300
MDMVSYRIIVCRDGFSSQMGDGLFSAACTITLIHGTFNILFDPGSPWDGEFVLSSLATHGLKPEDINFVICSHGHVDHIGNLNHFPNATIIIGTEIMRHDGIVKHNFSETNPFVRVVCAPGHTANDVVLVVERVPELGTVVASGDIFENQRDRDDPDLWKDNSLKPELQERSRRLITSLADYIIPGHGSMFKV